MHLRTVLVSVVVVLVGTTLAACGDKEDGTEKQTTSAEAESPTLTRSNFVSMLSQAMRKADSVHVESDGAEGAALALEADQRGNGSMALVMGAGPDRFEIRSVDGIVYVNLGEQTDNKFINLENEKSNPSVAQLGGIAEQFDVFKQFEAMQGAITGFEQKGKRKVIDGVLTTPYAITFDSAKVAKALGVSSSGMQGESAYTYFIGPDNLVRRMVTNTLGPTVTTEFTKWGETVDVKAPEAVEIVVSPGS